MRVKRATQRDAIAPARWLWVPLLIGFGACADAFPTEPELAAEQSSVAASRIDRGSVHFTGLVDLVWKGGQGAGAPAGAARMAQAEIAAVPGFPAVKPGPGNFSYRVINADGTVHREIGIKLSYAGLEDQAMSPGEVRFVGVVTSDTKPCGASQHDGGSCEHDDDGGCTHDDDGGCTHDDDGGCTHDDGTDHDGGCDGGGDAGGHEPGGGGQPGGAGGKVTGADCRIGQVVVGWALDDATPAVKGDRISWKWFAADAPKVAQIQQAIGSGQEITWPCKLCEKQIVGGNLKLFMKMKD